jgi:hypothetical protein
MERVVLENPETVQELDAILRDTFHPAFLQLADGTGYLLEPQGPNLELCSGWIGPHFGRTLRFMLFDHLGYPFFRGGLTISRAGFLVDREIWLGDHATRMPGHSCESWRTRRLSATSPPCMSNPPSSIRSGISATSSLSTPGTGSSRDRGRFTQPHSVT